MRGHERGEECRVGVYAVAERATEVERLEHRVGIAGSNKRSGISTSIRMRSVTGVARDACGPGVISMYAPRVAKLASEEDARMGKEISEMIDYEPTDSIRARR